MTGTELRALRRRSHISQAFLAQRLGLTDRTVRDWEKGHTPISPIAAYALDKLLAIAPVPDP